MLIDVNLLGRPVVFPEEVPRGAGGGGGGAGGADDSSSGNGSMATVTTPMLVDREQPPLDPAKVMMTLHENPLYVYTYVLTFFVCWANKLFR